MRERTMRVTKTRDGLSPLSCLPRAPCATIYTFKRLFQARATRLLSRENKTKKYGRSFFQHLRDVERNDEDAANPVARHFNLPNYSGQDIRNHGSLQSLPLSLKVGGLRQAERMAVQFARSFIHALSFWLKQHQG